MPIVILSKRQAKRIRPGRQVKKTKTNEPKSKGGRKKNEKEDENIVIRKTTTKKRRDKKMPNVKGEKEKEEVLRCQAGKKPND